MTSRKNCRNEYLIYGFRITAYISLFCIQDCEVVFLNDVINNDPPGIR